MYEVIFLNDVFVETETNEKQQDDLIDLKNIAKWNFWSRYLGPYAVASSVRKQIPNYSVKVIDYFTKIPDFFEYLEAFVGDETRYICISTTFLQNTNNRRINDFNLWFRSHDELSLWFVSLKKIAPNAKIVIGGHPVDTYFKRYSSCDDPSVLPYAMKTYVDFAIHGYGEKAMVDLLLNRTSAEHKKKVGKLTFISDGSKAGKDAVVDPIKWGRRDAIQHKEWLPLEISKGCRFGCKFCMFDRHGTTTKDPAALRNEMLHNYEKFGVTGYHLTDDTVNDSPDKIDMIHDVFTSLPFNPEWIAYARPDMFHRYPDMLEKMIESGCRGMFLGVETFNPTAAKIAGKGLDPEKVKQILKWIKTTAGQDVFVLASFIIGLVGETEESLDETLQYLLEQDAIDKITYDILYVRESGHRTTNKKDFSQDSDTYGFRNIRFFPDYYWEHDTLNYYQCKDIALKWKQILPLARYSGSGLARENITDFWSYPRMRSLGYDHAASFDMLKSGSIPEELYDKNETWIRTYHEILKNDNE